MNSVTFNYGGLSEPLEDQARSQGYTLGDKAEIMEKLAFGLVVNMIHGTLTHSAYEKALNRLHKKVMKEIKPLED